MHARKILRVLKEKGDNETFRSLRLPIKIYQDDLPREIFLLMLAKELRRIKPSSVMLTNLMGVDFKMHDLEDIMVFILQCGIMKIKFDASDLDDHKAHKITSYSKEILSLMIDKPTLLFSDNYHEALIAVNEYNIKLKKICSPVKNSLSIFSPHKRNTESTRDEACQLIDDMIFSLQKK